MDEINFAEEIKNFMIETSFNDLKQDLICPICHDYFDEPASTCCGHTFCIKCITQYRTSKNNSNVPCPICNTMIGTSSFQKHVFIESLMHKTIPDVMDRRKKEKERRDMLSQFIKKYDQSDRIGKISRTIYCCLNDPSSSGVEHMFGILGRIHGTFPDDCFIMEEVYHTVGLVFSHGFSGFMETPIGPLKPMTHVGKKRKVQSGGGPKDQDDIKLVKLRGLITINSEDSVPLSLSRNWSPSQDNYQRDMLATCWPLLYKSIKQKQSKDVEEYYQIICSLLGITKEQDDQVIKLGSLNDSPEVIANIGFTIMDHVLNNKLSL